MSWHKPAVLIPLWISSICLPVLSHPPPPAANDIFGTVNGCATGLVEMDLNQDGMVKKDEYLNFVNLLADFLCVPPRPIMDLEIQTVFFSIACLCQGREGYSVECCFGTDAAIWTAGASDAITRTQDQDSYLRAACLLTQAILGPQQCTIARKTLAPEAIVTVGILPPISSGGGPSDEQLTAIIIGALLLALLCCLLCCCLLKKNDEEEEVEDIIVKEEEIEQGEVPLQEAKKIEPVELQSEVPEEEPPIHESHSVPQAPAPAPPPIVPIFVPPPAVREEEEDSEDSENIGRKMGATMEDESEEENNRKFGGMGMLPGDPEPEGIVLRHVEVEKEGPPEYEYPERELFEQKNIPDEDSVQEFDPYVPDGGVYDPQRGPRAPVIMNPPNFKRQKKPKKEPYDPRKLRRQLHMGDGQVWDALSMHEEERAPSKRPVGMGVDAMK